MVVSLHEFDHIIRFQHSSVHDNCGILIGCRNMQGARSFIGDISIVFHSVLSVIPRQIIWEDNVQRLFVPLANA